MSVSLNSSFFLIRGMCLHFDLSFLKGSSKVISDRGRNKSLQ